MGAGGREDRQEILGGGGDCRGMSWKEKARQNVEGKMWFVGKNSAEG